MSYPPSGYGYGQPMPVRPPPDHPKATTAMVLGIATLLALLVIAAVTSSSTNSGNISALLGA